MANALKPRDAVVRMAAYHPPTGGREGKTRLDFNENTVGCSPKVIARLREKLAEETLTVYPEYEAAGAAAARFLGVGDDQFLLTNGTDEAIQVLINTFVDDHDEVIVLTPSYAMYKFYAEVAGANVVSIPYRGESLAFPLEELLAAITPRTRAILVSNPNNPTGSWIEIDAIRRIIEAAPHAAILVDEAYYEFYGITALGLIAEYPNLFVSRTFSKAFGMAALRLGVLVSQAASAAFCRKAQSPYSVNLLAAIALPAAVADTEYVRDYTAAALASRRLLEKGLHERGIRYWPSKANFILFDAGSKAVPLRDALRARGILVRDRSYELPGAVRVTCGTPPQTQAFFTAFDEVWPTL
ncbi:MAG: histidinol-phosphate transaminase [Bryobacter sp.]|nr:histidinol-phosphate transaminase [Bryobacter sp.]